MSNRNFSYIFSPDILWGNVSNQSETGLCNLIYSMPTGVGLYLEKSLTECGVLLSYLEANLMEASLIILDEF